MLQAYYKVKANKGSPGIDGESIEVFEGNLKNNLYRIWNRMSSGCYFPPSVKAVPIPKKSGGMRILGVPTVSDRVAQMVVKIFGPDLVVLRKKAKEVERAMRGLPGVVDLQVEHEPPGKDVAHVKGEAFVVPGNEHEIVEGKVRSRHRVSTVDVHRDDVGVAQCQ